MIGGRVILDVSDSERGYGGILTSPAIDAMRQRVVELAEYGLPRSVPIVVKVGDVGSRATEFAPAVWLDLVRNFDDIVIEGDVYTVADWVHALRDLLAEVAA